MVTIQTASGFVLASNVTGYRYVKTLATTLAKTATGNPKSIATALRTREITTLSRYLESGKSEADKILIEVAQTD